MDATCGDVDANLFVGVLLVCLSQERSLRRLSVRSMSSRLVCRCRGGQRMGGPHLEVRQPSRSTLISGDLVKDSLGSEAMRAVVYNAFHHRPEARVCGSVQGESLQEVWGRSSERKASGGFTAGYLPRWSHSFQIGRFTSQSMSN